MPDTRRTVTEIITVADGETTVVKMTTHGRKGHITKIVTPETDILATLSRHSPCPENVLNMSN